MLKIYQAPPNAANLDYGNNISIDEILLPTGGILPYEQVQAINVFSSEQLIQTRSCYPDGFTKIQLSGGVTCSGMVDDRS